MITGLYFTPPTEDVIKIQEYGSTAKPWMCKLICIASQASIAACVRSASAGAFNSVTSLLQTSAKCVTILKSCNKAGSSWHVIEQNNFRQFIGCSAADSNAQVLQGNFENLVGTMKECISKRIPEP